MINDEVERYIRFAQIKPWYHNNVLTAGIKVRTRQSGRWRKFAYARILVVPALSIFAPVMHLGTTDEFLPGDQLYNFLCRPRLS